MVGLSRDGSLCRTSLQGCASQACDAAQGAFARTIVSLVTLPTSNYLRPSLQVCAWSETCSCQMTGRETEPRYNFEVQLRNFLEDPLLGCESVTYYY